jgi:hypothetical protein
MGFSSLKIDPRLFTCFPTRKSHTNTVHFGGISKADGQRQFPLGKITAGSAYPVAGCLSIMFDKYDRALGIGVDFATITFDYKPDPLVLWGPRPQKSWLAAIGQHQHSGPSVAIKVRNSRTTTHHGSEIVGSKRFLRPGQKIAFSGIPKGLGRLGESLAGTDLGYVGFEMA